MVRLKVLTSKDCGLFFISFNSKMVRLKDLSRSTVQVELGSFNSKMVRLKGSFTDASGDGYEVSIPKWFD